MNPGDLIINTQSSSLDPFIAVNTDGNWISWRDTGGIRNPIDTLGVAISLVRRADSYQDPFAIFVVAPRSVGWDLRDFWSRVPK